MLRIFCILMCIPCLLFAKGIHRIRDAEIESFLNTLTKPLFEEANLSQVKLHLVADATPNAFVAKGQNLFVHAGLFILADHENEITGVLAHETGHIQGGHLSRLAQRIENAQIQAIIGMALGAGVMLGGSDNGMSEAGMAMMLGSSDMAQKSLLAYSRDEERMADEIGMALLEETDQSAQGFLSFMRKLKERQQLLVGENVSPYRMSHPLTEEREEYILQRMESDSDLRGTLEDASDQFKWVRAKSVGYFQPTDIETLFRKGTDPWRYAKTFQYVKRKQHKKALPLINQLIQNSPRNGYFHETKAQVLFGMGRIEESLKSYQKSLDLLDDHPLVGLEYCAAALESKSPNLSDLETRLNVILMSHPDMIYGYKLLATIYGNQKKKGMKAYALAEYFTGSGNKTKARQNIVLAEKYLDRESFAFLKLQDLKEALKKK